jgi:hypothetical protein
MGMQPTATILNSDCIRGMAEMVPGTVHLAVSSIPFEALFVWQLSI